jgi:hypothetical protein
VPVQDQKNLELLKSHLSEGSLARRLVDAYAEAASMKDVPAALDAVLEKRLAEVRNAIEYAAAKLD